MAQDMERANRITVQAEGDAFKAVFHRTHKLIGEILSKDTAWQADTRMNRTAQREMFRVWMMDHSVEYGIQYDPEDRRTSDNQMPHRYDTDSDAMAWAGRLVYADLNGWVAKIAQDMGIPTDRLLLIEVTGEEISERTGWNGRGVNPKYGNGAWAYADIKVTATVAYRVNETNTEYGYVGMVVNIVSGQLKKPSAIGELGYTYTGFRTEVMKDLQAAIEKDFPPKTTKKDATKDTTETKPAEETKSEPQQESKPETKGTKGGKKRSKKNNK